MLSCMRGACEPAGESLPPQAVSSPDAARARASGWVDLMCMLSPWGHGTGKADRKSTRLNSSHLVISYAVFCLKKKKSYEPDMGTYSFIPTQYKPPSECTLTLRNSVA